MTNRFIKSAVSLATGVLLFTSSTALAMPNSFIPYTSYDYNSYNESVPAPVGYEPFVNITGEWVGLAEPLSEPRDIYYDGEDTVYVLDSGNSRIVVLDTAFQLKAVWDEFWDADGIFPIEFTGAEGITVAKDGTIYIADTLNERVLVFNADCSLRQIITKPESLMGETLFPFDVSKVMTDGNNRLYMNAKSVNEGALVFDKNGAFEKYFGGNEVIRTGEVIANYILRRFLTPEQMRARTQATPVTISGFDIDDRGFIYTTTLQTDSKTAATGAVRKLNALGKNILNPDIVFGDLEWDRKNEKESVKTTFYDINVDSDGFLNLLDKGRGRIFQYSQEGELISVFGGYGDQLGTFADPAALESIGDRVYVVDAGKNCIYGFKPTAYAKKYRSAVEKLRMNDFEGALQEWQSLLSDNTNNTVAFYGMGRIYELQGECKTAMEYFKLADDRTAYSEVYREHRNTMIKQMLLPLLAGVTVICAGLAVLFKAIKKRRTAQASAYTKLESKYAFPLYTLFHPMDGFYQVKTRDIGSLRLSLGIIISSFFIFTAKFFMTGYIFNPNRVIDYNVFITLLQTIGLAVLFIAANWSVCTLMNGSGSLKKIVVVTAYSLIPALTAVILNLLLSNLLVKQESVFISVITVVSVIWSVLLLLCGLYCIHEYTMTKTLVSVVVTVLGMVVIILLIVMFFSLMQQTIDFIRSIVTEASLK